MKPMQLIPVEWPAHQSVHCVVTSRKGGCSEAPFDSLNLALHVGDDPARVAENRAALQTHCPDVNEWQWLQQVHGAQVHRLESAQTNLRGDGLITQKRGLACCIMTADCLPVLLCDELGKEIAAVHCGWRSLAQGILENTITKMSSKPDSLLAWLGPAIGPCHFEVGKDVKDALVAGNVSSVSESQFSPIGEGKFLANLYGIARMQLESQGIGRTFGSDFCTYCDSDQFYSYRRDRQCGRMVSAIYLA